MSAVVRVFILEVGKVVAGNKCSSAIDFSNETTVFNKLTHVHFRGVLLDCVVTVVGADDLSSTSHATHCIPTN